MTAPLATTTAAPSADDEPMTVEELAAAIQELLDQAVSADGTERDLTDVEVRRYEALELRLARAQHTRQLRERQAARRAPVPMMALIQGAPRQDSTLDRAFQSYLRTGRENQDLTQLRAQGEGTGSAGGYLVPSGFRQKLVDRLKAFGGIATVAEEFTTESGQPIQWPTVDDTSNVGEIVDEGGTFSSQADLTFGSASLGAYSYMAGGGSSSPLRLSLELVQDAAFDVEGLVSRKLSERIGRIQATHLAAGTGVGQPQGLVRGLTGIEILADGNGVTYDDLINFIHSVDPAYREMGNCGWVFNDTMWGTIKKIKDSHGDPIWRAADATIATTTEGQPRAGKTLLLDYPVTIDQALPSMTAASNTINWGAFGDIREGYVVRRVRDIQVIVNPWTRASNRQIEYTAWARMDAVQQNTNAYVALTGEQ